MRLLFREDPYLKTCAAMVTAVDARRVWLDQTVFYPHGGGQPGDTGTLRWDGGTAQIADTVKGDSHEISVIVLAEGVAPPPVGAPLTATLDWDRRHRLMRMHTTLHLLCSLVDGAVTGGQVGPDKSRLDFNIPSGAVDKADLTERLNRLVAEDHPVAAGTITDEDLVANPDLVRTMSVRPPSGAGSVRTIRIGGSGTAPSVDYQPCGGTHVARTGEIGRVSVTKIENKGKQNRRVVVALDPPV